jgi:uncharacterized MAPEG superfamily protein
MRAEWFLYVAVVLSYHGKCHGQREKTIKHNIPLRAVELFYSGCIEGINRAFLNFFEKKLAFGVEKKGGALYI